MVIVILLIRPWGASPDRSEAVATTVDAPSEASPRATGADGETGPSDAPDDPLLVTCGSPSGWRAATLQSWPGRTDPIRSWIAVQPVEASGPLDPRIPYAPVATGIVTAIGYCAPLDDTRPPASAGVSLWAVSERGATPLSLVAHEPATPDALGGLWLSPPELRGSTPADGVQRLWPPGRYALEVAVPQGFYDVWIGIEVKDLSLLNVPPVPAASASADATIAPGPSPSP